MKIAIAATLIASASAFAPVVQKASSSALTMSFENEIGAQPPLGFWDPLGLLKDADEEKFARLREVETKHGRIAQRHLGLHFASRRVPDAVLARSGAANQSSRQALIQVGHTAKVHP